MHAKWEFTRVFVSRRGKGSVLLCSERKSSSVKNMTSESTCLRLRTQYCTVHPFHSQQKSAKQPFECVRHVNRCTSNCCIDKSVFNLSWLVTELGVWRISCLLLRSHFMQHTASLATPLVDYAVARFCEIEFMVIRGMIGNDVTGLVNFHREISLKWFRHFCRNFKKPEIRSYRWTNPQPRLSKFS